jgi:uncharacterized metal-binding protein YceD (DUF177 family)
MAKQGDKQFIIPYLSLKEGVHEFSYHLEKDFFDSFGNDDFRDISLDVSVEWDKQPHHAFLYFIIKGTIDTQCDRCGDDLKVDIWDEFELILKWVDAEKLQVDQEDADIVYIDKQEHQVDLSEWLFEYAILSTPLQRIHTNDQQDQMCNQITLELINKNTKTEEETNSLTEQLLKLKFKK